MRDCESVIIGFVLVRFRLLCSLYAQAQLVTDWSPFCTVRRAVEWRRRRLCASLWTARACAAARSRRAATQGAFDSQRSTLDALGKPQL